MLTPTKQDDDMNEAELNGLRKKLDVYSLPKAAKVMGVHINTLQAFVYRGHTPKIVTLNKIKTFLGGGEK